MTAATLTSSDALSLGDQARGLRALIRQRGASSLATRGTRCRTIAVTSGKGGVGKSVMALNLAVGLAELGAKVCLVDGHQGLGNLDWLCGRNGYWNLSHVVAGSRDLRDVILDGPAGVAILPGAASLLGLRDCPATAREHLRHDLDHFTARFDLLVIDSGSGMHAGARRLTDAADEALIVTTPDPMAVAEAYAALKSLRTPAAHVAVNQASREQAALILERIQHTAQTYLRKSVTFGAGIPSDDAVPRSVRERTPFVMTAPETAVARALGQLARQLLALEPRRREGSYFQRLLEDDGPAKT